jgi:hypothetical protein
MILLNVQIGLSIGAVQMLMVSVFYICFLTVGYIKKYTRWNDLLSFLIPISIFYTIPDWFLANQLSVLEFSKDTSWSYDGIPIYLVGMWTISMFLMIYNAIFFQKKFKNNVFLIVFLLVASTFIFILSDQMLWQIALWKYNGVKMLDRTPIFIIPTNLLLGVYTYFGYQIAKNKPFLNKILIAFCVMLLRFGLIMASYYVVEHSL